MKTKELLDALTIVKPGLSNKEIIEQANAFDKIWDEIDPEMAESKDFVTPEFSKQRDFVYNHLKQKEGEK